MDLIELRPAMLFVHVVAAFVFILCHGVAVFVGFDLRRDPEPGRVRHLIELSGHALPIMNGALLVTLITGLVAAIIAGQFAQLWPWISIAIVIAVMVVMHRFASVPFARMREAVGIRSMITKKGDPDPTPGDAHDVRAAVLDFRPEVTAVIGLGALIGLIWLMRYRPF